MRIAPIFVMSQSPNGRRTLKYDFHSGFTHSSICIYSHWSQVLMQRLSLSYRKARTVAVRSSTTSIRALLIPRYASILIGLKYLCSAYLCHVAKPEQSPYAQVRLPFGRYSFLDMHLFSLVSSTYVAPIFVISQSPNGPDFTSTGCPGRIGGKRAIEVTHQCSSPDICIRAVLMSSRTAITIHPWT